MTYKTIDTAKLCALRQRIRYATVSYVIVDAS